MDKVLFLRLKLAIIIFASIAIIFIKDLFILILLFLILSTFIICRKSQRKLSARFYPLLFIGLLVVLFQLLLNTSVNVPTRLMTGIVAALRIINLSFLVFIFTQNTSTSEIIRLFSFLPKSIQLMLTITFSLIPVIIEEARKIMLVQNSRGYNTNFLRIFNNIIPIIIPLLHRTLRRSEQIAMVMQSRGYDES